MSCNLCVLYYHQTNWINCTVSAQIIVLSPDRPRDIGSRYKLSERSSFLYFDLWLLVTMSESRISIFSQLFAPKPLWTSKDVPDQTGKTVLITGGNRGIGKELARVRRWITGEMSAHSPTSRAGSLVQKREGLHRNSS